MDKQDKHPNNGLIRVIGVVEDTDERTEGVALAVFHPDPRIVMCVVDHIMTRVLPQMEWASEMTLKVMAEVDKAEAKDADDQQAAAVEAKVEAGEGAAEAAAAIDRMLAAIRDANPGARRPQ